jgi:hypothetical protein
MLIDRFAEHRECKPVFLLFSATVLYYYLIILVIGYN